MELKSTLLPMEVYSIRVQEVIKNKNISINLSLDALTKELFEKIRINSNFDTIIKNFMNLKSIVMFAL